MVRFKNRHLLVEFLSPSNLTPTISTSTSIASSSRNLDAYTSNAPAEDDEEVDDDDEGGMVPIPVIPFMLPLDSKRGINFGGDGASAVFRAVRGCIQDVFGDEGWGRVASSFKVIYHSPQTTLTILRIARQHYRLIWAALTFITQIERQPVLPRVVAVSGTIKKLQNRAIGYHRLVTGMMLTSMIQGQHAEIDQETIKEKFVKEEKDLEQLDD